MFLTSIALGLSAAQPATIERIGDPARPDHIILQAVRIPPGSEMLVLSGQVATPVDPARPATGYGDTETQGLSALKRIEGILKRSGFAMSDVVSLKVYLVGDPAKGGKMDFDGWNRAYGKVFGPGANPRVARTTMQIVGLAAPGLLVEIDAVAAKAPRP